ncbi:MAG: hypothetical protein RJR37_05855 [Peptococcaceae bacterium MAG4]|nr:hypothetical protein [Peptococcaceae bacterium MAG4]
MNKRIEGKPEAKRREQRLMNFDERMAQLQRELPDLRIYGKLECPICGMCEVLYIDRVKGVLLRTCRTCN